MALKYKIEPTWHVAIAVAIAIVLQLLLSSRLTIGPKYVMGTLEL